MPRAAVVAAAATAVGLAAALVAPAGAQTPGSAVGQTPGSAGAQAPGSPAPAGPGATASTAADPDALVRPPRLDAPPPGRRLTGDRVIALAGRVPSIAAERRRFRDSFPNVFLKGPDRWQVSFYSRDRPPKEIAQVLVDDAGGRVLEAWTGPQVAWTMARGYPGAFGRKINSPWVWVTLTVLFVLPFVDPRRPLRMLHLDLLVLCAFGISLAFFNDANLDVSVPIVAPLLAYVAGRMLWLGLRRRDSPEVGRPLPLLVPVAWLAVGLVFLVGFRIGLNVTNANVIDVGAASVIGADRLAAGQTVWGAFPEYNQHGDTYGPVTYAAYVPFEQALPFDGVGDDGAAAHAAAICFDLLCLALLFGIGRRVRGPGMGIALAYAWAAFPFTLYALNTNVNDGLVAALVLAAVLSAASPPARGALIALAGAAKFAPLALVPLFATAGPRRGVVRFALAFAAVAALAVALVLAAGDLRTFYDRTVAFQAQRDAPFSVWGLYGWGVAQAVVQGAAVLLAVLVAFVPRRPGTVGLAALSAAVLAALQLGLTYWFYLYLVWFAGLAFIALLARYGEPGPLVHRGPLAADDRTAEPRALVV